MNTMKKFTHDALSDEDGNPIYLNVPSVRIVCPSCDGNGTHDRRDIDTSRLVQNMEEDGDYDGLEDYYAGRYDVICSQCKGRNVVDDFDYDYIRKNHPNEWSAILDYNESERQYRREVEAERRMGC